MLYSFIYSASKHLYISLGQGDLKSKWLRLFVQFLERHHKNFQRFGVVYCFIAKNSQWPWYFQESLHKHNGLQFNLIPSPNRCLKVMGERSLASLPCLQGSHHTLHSVIPGYRPTNRLIFHVGVPCCRSLSKCLPLHWIKLLLGTDISCKHPLSTLTPALHQYTKCLDTVSCLNSGCSGLCIATPGMSQSVMP